MSKTKPGVVPCNDGTDGDDGGGNDETGAATRLWSNFAPRLLLLRLRRYFEDGTFVRLRR